MSEESTVDRVTARWAWGHIGHSFPGLTPWAFEFGTFSAVSWDQSQSP